MAPSVDSSRLEARPKAVVDQTSLDHGTENIEESESSVVDVRAAVQQSMQSSFGNAIVQAALSGSDIGPLGDVVAGEIAAANAGMGAMSSDGAGLAAIGNAALARVAAGVGDAGMSQAQALSDLRAGTGGQALPTGVRGQMEAAFGRSFADVRVHTGERSANAAAALNAEAVALGSHIHFGRGQYAPGTSAGDAVIAHELTHVVQAAEGRLPGTGGVSDKSMAAEREAYGNENLAGKGPMTGSKVVQGGVSVGYEQAFDAALGAAIDSALGGGELGTPSIDPSSSSMDGAGIDGADVAGGDLGTGTAGGGSIGVGGDLGLGSAGLGDAGVTTAASIDTGVGAGALGLPSLGIGSMGIGFGSIGSSLGMATPGGAMGMAAPSMGGVGAMAAAPSTAAASAPAMLREDPSRMEAMRQTDREASIQHELEMGLDMGFERAVDVSQGDGTSNIPKEGTGRREGVFHGPSKSGHHAVNEYMDVMKAIGPDGMDTRSDSDDYIRAPAVHTFSQNDGHAHLDGSPKLGAEPEGSKRKNPLPPPSPSSSKKGPFEDAAVNSALQDAFGPDVQKLDAKFGRKGETDAVNAAAFTEGSTMTFPGNVNAHSDMAVVGEEVAHALAKGGNGQTALDQPGDPGEARAHDAGKQFADFAKKGGKAPDLGAAAGGRARIHRAPLGGEPEKKEPPKEAPKPKVEAAPAPKTETPKAEAPRTETPKTETPKTETPRELTPTEQASARLKELKDKQAAALKAGNTDFKHDISTIADAAGDYKKAMESMSPAERAEFMKGEGKELAGLISQGLTGRGDLDKAGKDSYQSAVNGLVGGAETLGKDGIGTVTDTLFQGGNGKSLVDDENFAESLNKSIRGGNGGLLAASATNRMRADVQKMGLIRAGTRGQIVAETHQAFSDMTRDFKSARDARIKHEQKFAPVMKAIQVGQNSAIPDQDQLQKDVEAFQARHNDVRGKEEAAAEKFTSTLAGQDLLTEGRGAMPSRLDGQLPAETVAMASVLGETNAGRNAVGEALRDIGTGGDNWLSKTGSQAKGDLAKDFGKTVQNGALQGMIDRGAAKDPKSAGQMMAGASQLLAGDPAHAELAKGMKTISDQLAAGADPASLKTDLNGKTGTPQERMLNRLLSGFDTGQKFADGFDKTQNGPESGRFGRIGGAIKAAGGIEKILAGDGGKDLLTGGADVVGGAADLFSKGGSLTKALGKFALGADTLFSGIDFAEGVMTGDTDKAVKSGLKLGTAALMATRARAFAGPIGLASTMIEVGYNQWAHNRDQAEISGEMMKTLGPSVRKGLETNAGMTDPKRIDQATETLLRRETLRSNGVNGAGPHDGDTTNLEKLGMVAKHQKRSDLSVLGDMTANPNAFRDRHFDDAQMRTLENFRQSQAQEPDGQHASALSRQFNKVNGVHELPPGDRWSGVSDQAWTDAWREENEARRVGP